MASSRDDDSRTTHRATYEPPRIRRVSLAAEEMAVTTCKRQITGTNLCKKGNQFIIKTVGS